MQGWNIAFYLTIEGEPNKLGTIANWPKRRQDKIMLQSINPGVIVWAISVVCRI